MDLNVNVDDLQWSTSGTNEAITTHLTEATEDFSHLVEHQIEARLVPTKAVVGASTAALARKLRAALGDLAGARVDVIEALGIDFAAARPRAPLSKVARSVLGSKPLPNGAPGSKSCPVSVASLPRN